MAAGRTRIEFSSKPASTDGEPVKDAGVFDTDDVPVHDVVRSLLSEGRSGRVVTEDGQLSFREGRIVAATFQTASGPAAVLRTLLLTDGEYSVCLEPVRQRADFVLGLDELCNRYDSIVARFMDISSRALPIDAVLGVDFQQLAAHLSSLPDEVNALVRLFDGHRRVRDVIVESTFTETVALEAATRLYTLGVLSPASNVPPAQPRVAPRFMEPRSQPNALTAPVPPSARPDPIVDRMSPQLQAQLDAFATKQVAEPVAVLPKMHVSQLDAFAAGLETYDRSLEDAINASLVHFADETPAVATAPEVDVDVDVADAPVAGEAAPVKPSRPLFGAMAITAGVVAIAAGLAFTVGGRNEAPSVASSAPASMPAIDAPQSAAAEQQPTLAQAVAFYEAGFISDAVTLLEQLVMRHDDPGAWTMLGLARFDSGDGKGAEVAARKALELDASQGRARMLLASIYISWREHDLADAQLQKYLEVEPRGEFASKARGLLSRKKLPRQTAQAE